ncbi:MAG: hypothetical protein PW843_11855 [Azospirillaceae bacterium]|nr:hypothetical protein [Azospirillaceae bacterium]
MLKQADVRGYGINKKTKAAFLLGSSALAIGTSLALPQAAHGNTIFSASTSSPVNINTAQGTVVVNSGVTLSGVYTAMSITAAIGTLTNNGYVGGSYSGINNQQTSIGTLANTGIIRGTELGISNNNATITNLVNSGTILGATIGSTIPSGVGVYNDGVIGTLTNANTGLIQGWQYAIQNLNGTGTGAISGSIGLISNSGTIAGNIQNDNTTDLTIAGGSGTTIGTLTGYTIGNLGVISNTGGNVVLSTGNILLNDNVTVTGHTLSNTGAAVTLTTLVSVTGNYNQSAGTLVVQNGGKLAVSGSATVGGTVVATLNATSNYLATGGSVTTLVAGGTGSNYSSVVVNTIGLSPTVVSASGAISGINLILSVANDYIGGTLASIGNTGVLAPTGSISAVYVAGTGRLGTLVNAATGTISGFYAVRVSIGGSIGGITNSGLISGNSGGAGGIFATLGASIGTITNNATGTIMSAALAALNDPGGVIGTITNAGLVTHTSTGIDIFVAGTISQVNNSGTIRNQSTTYGAVYVGGTTTLTSGTLTTLSNSGLIQNASASGTGTVAAILVDGYTSGGTTLYSTLGTLLNNATGIISARTAIRISSLGTIGTLVNSGTIMGSITNLAARDLSITGGSGTTVGTFTGLTGTVGTINNTLSNLVFGDGTVRSNILLNDAIVATGRTVLNNSANLSFGSQSVATIAGTFVQGSLGTLSLGTTQLSISGAASIAGTVLGAFDTSVNHTPGEGITLVTADGGLSLSNGTLTGVVRASGTGINAGASISGNSLLAQVQNYYIATTYGTVTNTGNLTSTSAVYVASGASLGAVSNSGTIQGNIVNLSANDLTLLGGSAGTYGTYTGLSGTATGSIQNSLSNVTLAGNVLLNDGVNVGGTTHAVVADGASVLLNAAINVTGNYSQTGGTLLEAGGGGELIVSGAAVLSGVSYSVVGATSAYHYLIGPAGLTPIVAGGAGSSYTSITYSSGIAGLTLGGYTQGNSLWGTVLNDYVGDSLASIAVANGTTLSSPSVQTLIYISSAGTLGTLSNSGVIQGNIVNNGSAALNLVGGASGTVGTFTGAGGTLGTITNTLSNVVVANGNVRIADQVNVGSGLLYVTNGTLSVAPGVTVSGNYRQDNPNGTLSLGVGEKLIVTGSATISDGYIQVGSFDGLTNHVAGETTTLVQAGAASFYTLTSAVQGVPVVYSTVDGLGVAGTQVGNNLLASIQNDYFGTSTASFTQAGTIVLGTYNATQYVPNAALFVAGTASIGTLTNIGVLDAEASDGYGIFLASSGTLVASIGTLVNSGTIAGRVGIGNFSGVIGTIDNSGLIQDSLPNSGIYNGNTITLVNNQASGTIAGGYGIYNSGLLSTIANAGLITGTASNGSSGAAGVVNYATIGTLTNSGTIAASGTISAYTYNVIAGVQNGGTITTLSNSGVITATGTISDPTGTMSNGHHLVAGIANSGTLGTLVNAAGGTIAASGTISAHTYNVIAGVQNQGSITTLSNSGVIAVNGIITNSIGTGYNAVAAIANVGGTIDALTNSGSISGTLAGGVMVLNSRAYHVALFNSGTIGTLTNNTGAVIRDDYTGIANYAGGTIAGLTNDGTITGDARSGIHNEGFIATLTNNGLISSGSTGIWSGSVATIGTLVNNGVIHGDNLGYVNRPLGVLGTLVNAAGATLSGASTAINNAGSIGLISNSGTIVGNGSTGLVNLASGTIGTVLNAVGGVIGGGSTGIFNAGTIGTLVNSGLINAARALSNSGALLGGIANSGTIAGNITNAAASALTISGGTGATVGTLTGVSTGLGSADQGLISITSAGLVFSSGNLLLNDNITATGQTVTNAGASLRLANSVTVTGAYAQGSIGTLVLASGAVLSVTSAANITVGTVTSAGFNATGNYVAGGSNVTLVVGGTGSSYDASVVAGGGITGLGLTGSVAGNNLLAVVGNDYVGGSQATLSNTGSLTYNSASTGAVYVASTGTLGTLANSGTIAGSIAVQVASGGTLGVLSDTGLIQGGIVNLASRVLTISGGSGTTVGTLTGLSGLGTITSTLANVLLASGNLLLNDQVNVGTGTLVNAASATVTGNVSVTGNFSQSTGTLVIRNGGGELFVSGAATMSGGTVLATNVPGTMNATAGQVSTALVAAGAASSYTNLTYGVDVTGLEVTGTNIANTLYLQALNDYVGGTVGTLSNTGTISANNAVYVAATGTLGTLFNSGTLLGASAALSNLGSLTTILNGTLGTAVSPGLMAGAVGIANAGYLGTLTNYATILGTTGAAVDNQGTLFGLGNAGTMTGVTSGPVQCRQHDHRPERGPGLRFHRCQQHRHDQCAGQHRLRHAAGQHRRVGDGHPQQRQRRDRHAGERGPDQRRHGHLQRGHGHAGHHRQQRHHCRQHHQPVVGRPGAGRQRRHTDRWHHQQHLFQRGVRGWQPAPGGPAQCRQPHGGQQRRQPGAGRHRDGDGQLQPGLGHAVGHPRHQPAGGDGGGQHHWRHGAGQPVGHGQLPGGQRLHPGAGRGGVQLHRRHGDGLGRGGLECRGQHQRQHLPAVGQQRLCRRQHRHAVQHRHPECCHGGLHRLDRHPGNAGEHRPDPGQHRQLQRHRLDHRGRHGRHGGHADGPVGPGHHHQHARQRGAGVRQPGAERRHQCRHRHPGQRRRQRPADQHRLGHRRLQPVGRHLGPWRQPAGGQRCRQHHRRHGDGQPVQHRQLPGGCGQFHHPGGGRRRFQLQRCCGRGRQRGRPGGGRHHQRHQPGGPGPERLCRRQPGQHRQHRQHQRRLRGLCGGHGHAGHAVQQRHAAGRQCRAEQPGQHHQHPERDAGHGGEPRPDGGCGGHRQCGLPRHADQLRHHPGHDGGGGRQPGHALRPGQRRHHDGRDGGPEQCRQHDHRPERGPGLRLHRCQQHRHDQCAGQHRLRHAAGQHRRVGDGHPQQRQRRDRHAGERGPDQRRHGHLQRGHGHAGHHRQQRHHRRQHHQPVVGRPGGGRQRRHTDRWHHQQHLFQRGVRGRQPAPGRPGQRGQPHGGQQRGQPGAGRHRDGDGQLQPGLGHAVGQPRRQPAGGDGGGQHHWRHGAGQPVGHGRVPGGQRLHPGAGWGGVQLHRRHGGGCGRGRPGCGGQHQRQHLPAVGQQRLCRRQHRHAVQHRHPECGHGGVHRLDRHPGCAGQQRPDPGQHHQQQRQRADHHRRHGHHGGHADRSVGPGHHHQHARQRGAGQRRPVAQRRGQRRHRHAGQQRRQRPAGQHRQRDGRLQPVGGHADGQRDQRRAGGQQCRQRHGRHHRADGQPPAPPPSWRGRRGRSSATLIGRAGTGVQLQPATPSTAA